MIEYETTDSSFFRENKIYCENIESKLKTLNIDCSGYCNCFGYELTTKFERNDMSFDLKFIKYQTTQNGVTIAVDAHEYAGIELTIKGLNPEYKLTVGKSSLLRYFCSKEIKEKTPKPYFIKLRDSQNYNYIDNLVKVLVENHISKIRLKNGKFTTTINVSTNDPIKLIKNVEYIIKNVP